MIEKRRLAGSAAGLIGVGVYAVLSLLSYLQFDGSFGPMSNWLSDLGHRILNPAGSLMYRLGGILGGSALLLFFLFLDVPRGRRARFSGVALVLIRVFGGIASVCFVLTGVFPEDMMPVHSWFSIANFAAFGTAVAMSGVLALATQVFPPWFSIVCLAGWAADLLSWIWGQARWLEWVVVALLILYVVSLCVILLTIGTPRHKRTRDGNAGHGRGPGPRQPSQ